MKIIFLDIDGVLTSHRTAIAFGWYPTGLSDLKSKIDPVALALLQGICRGSDASVVISSTWRKFLRREELQVALGLPIIDVTPVLDGMRRGNEIDAWLTRHPEVTHYCIVDDDTDMLPEQKRDHFVHINEREGITFGDADMIACMLGLDIWSVNRGG